MNLKIVHPILFSWFPVLFLIGKNGDGGPIDYLVILLLFSANTILSIVVWGSFAIITKDKNKSSLLTSLSLIIFYSYGYIYSFLSAMVFPTLRHKYLAGGLLLLFSYLSYRIWRSSSKFPIITNIFNYSSYILVLLNIVISVFILAANWQTEHIVDKRFPSNIENDNNLHGKEVKKSPDVIYIVLDEYASSETLKKIYGVDKNSLDDFLLGKGFNICKECETKYIDSRFSIGDALNLGHMIVHKNGNFSKDSSVIKLFKRKGYRYIHIETAQTFWFYRKYANEIYRPSYNSKLIEYLFYDDFVASFIDMTILAPLIQIYCGSEHADTVLRGFENIKQMPYVKGPKFVFAHILSPHTPFVFDSKGKKLQFSSRMDSLNYRDKTFYLEQYLFITQKVEEVITSLFKNYKTLPIIIIQSDHGPRGGSRIYPEFRLDIDMEDMKSIYCAYYLPNDKGKIIYSKTTNADVFKKIEEYLFN